MGRADALVGLPTETSGLSWTYAWVAQLVEHLPEEEGVAGSIPAPSTRANYMESQTQSPFEAEKEIEVNGDVFSLLRIQRRGTTAIYRSASGQSFMRLGEPKQIKADLKLHTDMAEKRIPVAAILAEGEHKGHAYYIEESLGENHFGALFQADYVEKGSVSIEHFQEFLAITQKYLEAQFNTVVGEYSTEEFAKALHLDELCAEIPEHAEKIRERFAKAIQNTSVYSCGLIHGDFNPFNMYPKGIIDFEDTFYGPLPYDAIVAIHHNDYFPATGDYEYLQKFAFSPEQKQTYLEMVDTVYEGHSLPPPSAHLGDLTFFRALWATVRMQQWPKIQQFRYRRLIEKL